MKDDKNVVFLIPILIKSSYKIWPIYVETTRRKYTTKFLNDDQHDRSRNTITQQPHGTNEQTTHQQKVHSFSYPNIPITQIRPTLWFYDI